MVALKRINWTFAAGLFLAAISLVFSATGLVHLFAGAGLSIVVMAIAFEVAKTTLTINLVQRARQSPVWAVVWLVPLLLLTMISSVGISGYLSRAYEEGHAVVTQGAGDIHVVEEEIASLNEDRARLYGQVDAIPATHSTNRQHMLETVQPQIAEIAKRLTEKRDEASRLKRAQVGHEVDVGEYRYAANLIGIDEATLVKGIILTLSYLLDPLAILLILTSGVKTHKDTSTEVLDVPGGFTSREEVTVIRPAKFDGEDTPHRDEQPDDPELSPALNRVLRKARKNGYRPLARSP